MSSEFSYVGTRAVRPDIAPKVTGEARFTEDVAVPDALAGRVLRSPHPHARIRGIDASKARQLPGVVAVVTHEDVPRQRFSRSTLAETLPAFAFGGERQDQYILTDKARCVGDWVAAVAAEDVHTAERALELIEVDYEPLPVVFDPFAALEPSAPQLHDDAPGNLAFAAEYPYNSGDVGAGFEQADVVVEFSGVNSRQKHLHLETDAAVAWWDANRRLTVISPCQGAHLARKHLSKRIFPGIDEGDIRWITPFIGGGFGARLGLGVEPVAVLLATVTGRPVRVTTTREEDFSGYNCRTDQHQTIRLGAKRDGTLTAIEQRIVSDAGGYLSHSATTSMVNFLQTLAVFRCPNIHGEVRIAYTNTPTTSAFRGYGNPEGTFVMQQAVDGLAERLDMDPVEIRLTNISRVGDPEIHGVRPLEHTRLAECLQQAADRFGWTRKWRGWQRDTETGRYRRGVGVSVLSNCTSAGGFLLEHSSAALRVVADGSAILTVSPTEMGQGVLGGLRQIAAEAAGLQLEKISVVSGDTDLTSFDIGSHASRSMNVIGSAVVDAGTKIKNQIRELAAPRFPGPVTPDELEVREGRVFRRDAPDDAVDVAAVAFDAINNFGSAGAQIAATGSYLSTGMHPNHQAAFAEVEVDTATGKVRLLHYVVAHDIGRAINPALVEGQLEGGTMQGIGFALTEDFTVDATTGRVLTDSFFTYHPPTATDVPDMELLIVEDPAPTGAYGAKGVGEAPAASPAAAIANAVYDAIGVRIHSLPMSPEKVLWALRSRGAPAPGSSRVTGQYVGAS